MVNPRQIRDFARASGRLAKTDRLDAEVIARFAEAVRPAPRPLPSAAAQALAELVARRRQLVAMITSEGRRRRQTREARLQRRIEAHLSWLQKELSALETDLDDAVRATPAWRVAEDLLASVPGIGKTSAHTLIAKLPRARQPRSQQDRGPGRRRADQPRQRHLPWPPHGHGGPAPASAPPCTCRALTAIRRNPALQAFYRRLIGFGRPAKAAITACMRKLLVILNAILRNHRPWQTP